MDDWKAMENCKWFNVPASLVRDAYPTGIHLLLWPRTRIMANLDPSSSDSADSLVFFLLCKQDWQYNFHYGKNPLIVATLGPVGGLIPLPIQGLNQWGEQ